MGIKGSSMIDNRCKLVMALICFFIFLYPSLVAAEPNELFIDVTEPSLDAKLDQARDPTILRARYVLVNLQHLAGREVPDGATNIILNLFHDVSLLAVKDSMVKRSENRYTWFGRVHGAEFSQIILVVENGFLAGNVRLDGKLYQIRSIGEGVHEIREIDQNAFPEEAPSIPIVPNYEPDLGFDLLQADDGSFIDVMVIYTDAAAGNSANIASEIQLAIDETNLSYENSGITHRLRLVHSEPITYTESGDANTDLNRLWDPADGYLDIAHSARDDYMADVVSLWVEDLNACGIGFLMSVVSESFEGYAFSVVRRDCATGYYSFGHEIGHNMSARHDRYVDDTDKSPYSYNHGYVDSDNMWRTIMAYNAECSDAGFNCQRIAYWSNPDITYNGAPTGIPEGYPEAADNRKTLNNTAYTVANFRQGVLHDDLVVDFGSAYGTFIYYNNSAWSKLHGLSPTLMAEGDLDGNGRDDLVAVFAGFGTYVYYNNSTWNKLHSLSPTLMATGDLDGEGHDDLIAVFAGYGTYVYYNNSGWTKLQGLGPSLIATGDMDGGGQDELIAVFAGYGTYVYYNNSSWSKLHGLVPELIDITDLDYSGEEDLVVDFGPAYGMHVYYNDAAWSKLHSLSPTLMLADDMGGIALGFSGYGLYYYAGWDGAWTKYHSLVPETGALADIDGDGSIEGIADFGVYGIWVWDDQSGWSKLHGLSADDDAGICAAEMDGI
jgi:hypothetical protein